ncbi:MAG: alkaline phosphatase family protein, partial [Nitrososphaerales archaeon]
PNTYDDVGVNSTLRDGRDVWEIVGQHNKKVVVVNTPLTYPPRPVNGFLVCGFMAPGPEYGFTYPSSLSADIKRRIPNYRIGTAPSYIKSLYLKELNNTVQMVGDAAVYLLKQIDWDFAFIVFKETDEVQHSFYDRPGSMLTLYQRVDQIAGKLVALAGDNSHIFVVSDHGGEPINKQFNVVEYLRRSGFIRLNYTAPRKSTSILRLGAKTMLDLRLQWLLDVPGARKLLGQLMALRWRSTQSDGDDGFYGGKIDWDKTTAFISSGIGLRINLKGREPQGCIDEADFVVIRDNIAEQLAGVRDPQTGSTVFEYALPKEKVLSGPHLADAPDIVCLPNTGYLPTEALTSFDPIAAKVDQQSLFSKSSVWCGTHSPRGIVAIAGPGIKQSRIEGAKLDDIAPSILYAMNLPIPRDMDGRVLSEVFEPEILKANPITWDSEEVTNEQSTYYLSPEEESKIEERLKALGYLS